MPKSQVNPIIRIGIVDDFRMLVDGLVAELSDPDYRLDVTLTAVSWDELLNHPAYPPEVVILDLNLGDGIGIESKIRALRASGSEVVIVSRHSHANTVARALGAGALGFVPKTAGAAELARATRRAYTGQRTLPPELMSAIGSVPNGQLPRLGRQEQRALALYATGRSMRDVADAMNTTEETVKSYVKRARRKYREAGIDIGTKLLLRSQGAQEGWLPND